MKKSSQAPAEERFKKMPLLDSFLRESAKFSPLDSCKDHSRNLYSSGGARLITAVSINRKVLLPVRFSDGSYLPEGNLVCVPQQVLTRDVKFYDNPTEFDGFRFVVQDESGIRSSPEFTDVTPSFPFWGSPTKAW